MKKTPDWIENLKQCDVVPPGYYSVAEVASKINLSRFTAASRLKKLESEGKIKSLVVLVNGYKIKYYGQ